MSISICKIGILGGTFNPIHVGHLLMAKHAQHQFTLDKILFIPTGHPPHKTSSEIAKAKDRLQMVSLAIEDDPHFEVSDIELHRKGMTYSIDTLRELKRQWDNEVTFYFIMGADVMMNLTTWKDIHYVCKLCEFITMIRKGYDHTMIQNEARRLQEMYHAKVHLCEFPILDISSTEIRNRLSQNIPIDTMVSHKVANFIFRHGIYKKEGFVNEESRSHD
jgi:nicotinate-nucleotide adenylyltransferase